MFYMELGSCDKAYIKYRIIGNIMYIDETNVPPKYRGGGLTKTLVEHAIKYTEEHGLMIMPLCSYVKRYFEKYPGKKYLLARTTEL